MIIFYNCSSIKKSCYFVTTSIVVDRAVADEHGPRVARLLLVGEHTCISAAG